MLAVGDRPTVIAALVAKALGLPGHPPEAAAIARHKQLTRERLRDAGLPVPWFVPTSIDADPRALASSVTFPCVIKPVALSGSRGVMRADDEPSFVAAFERLRALMRSPEVRAERNDAHSLALVEGFIPGREFALEGLMHHGELHVLALFDKPDPLDGPFFEETIYVTPSTAARRYAAAIVDAVSAGRRGDRTAPRSDPRRVPRQRAAACSSSRSPRGRSAACAPRAAIRADGRTRPCLEELLLRHALRRVARRRGRASASASGVMMIPIPQRGIFRGVAGVDDARAVAGDRRRADHREAGSAARAAARRRELSRLHLRARRRTRGGRRSRARATRARAVARQFAHRSPELRVRSPADRACSTIPDMANCGPTPSPRVRPPTRAAAR